MTKVISYSANITEYNNCPKVDPAMVVYFHHPVYPVYPVSTPSP